MHDRPDPFVIDSDKRREASDRPVLLLEISRGLTRFPFRPVLVERFLIGSSPTCDLCLGGQDFPAMHSMIVHEHGDYRWESVMSEPAVQHNGLLTDSFRLQPGDRISVGPIELAVHFAEQSEMADDPVAEVVSGDRTSDSQDGPEDLSQLSAVELMDRMERDGELVELFESRRHLGLTALLDAARRHTGSKSAGSHVAQPRPLTDEVNVREDGQLLASLELMAEQLNDCVKDLEGRATVIAAGHERLAETLQSVMDAERHLAERLSTLFDKMPVIPSEEASERSAA